MPASRRPALAALGLAALLLSTGCGDGVGRVGAAGTIDLRADSAAVKRVGEDYLRSLARKDARAACALWTEKGRERLVSAARKTGGLARDEGCEDWLRTKLSDPRFDVEETVFRADMVPAAMVTFTNEGQAEIGMDPPLPPLARADGQWRFVDFAAPSQAPVPRLGTCSPE